MSKNKEPQETKDLLITFEEKRLEQLFLVDSKIVKTLCKKAHKLFLKTIAIHSKIVELELDGFFSLWCFNGKVDVTYIDEPSELVLVDAQEHFHGEFILHSEDYIYKTKVTEDMKKLALICDYICTLDFIAVFFTSTGYEIKEINN